MDNEYVLKKIIPAILTVKYIIYIAIIWLYISPDVFLLETMASIIEYSFWFLFGIILISTLILPTFGEKVSSTKESDREIRLIKNKITLNIPIIGHIESVPYLEWGLYIGVAFILVDTMIDLGLISAVISMALPVLLTYLSMIMIRLSGI